MNAHELSALLRPVLTGKGLAAPDFAVVIPLVCREDGPWLLIEVRAAGISQAGDPCFPGGRIEPGETPARAASRELYEELGLRISPERFLGQLPTVHTYLGSRTDVFVCPVTPEEAAEVRTAPEEVEVLLTAPLRYFLDRPGASSYPVDGHTVWGMTAGAIRHLCDAWNRAAGQNL